MVKGTYYASTNLEGKYVISSIIGSYDVEVSMMVIR